MSSEVGVLLQKSQVLTKRIGFLCGLTMSWSILGGIGIFSPDSPSEEQLRAQQCFRKQKQLQIVSPKVHPASICSPGQASPKVHPVSIRSPQDPPSLYPQPRQASPKVHPRLYPQPRHKLNHVQGNFTSLGLQLTLDKQLASLIASGKYLLMQFLGKETVWKILKDTGKQKEVCFSTVTAKQPIP